MKGEDLLGGRWRRLLEVVVGLLVGCSTGWLMGPVALAVDVAGARLVVSVVDCLLSGRSCNANER